MAKKRTNKKADKDKPAIGTEAVKCACRKTEQRANFAGLKGDAKKDAIKKFSAALTAACPTCKAKAEK